MQELTGILQLWQNIRWRGTISNRDWNKSMDWQGMPAIFSSQTEGKGMAKAVWNNQVLAESNKTVVVEGNHYFPPDAVKTEYFQPSETHTVCSWKGVASYYDVVVDGQVNRDAAWYYPNANNAAQHVKGYVAFWHGVKVEA
jgi:uncharacterized protein (DUF427 family)